jgi:hypothetical protein
VQLPKTRLIATASPTALSFVDTNTVALPFAMLCSATLPDHPLTALKEQPYASRWPHMILPTYISSKLANYCPI